MAFAARLRFRTLVSALSTVALPLLAQGRPGSATGIVTSAATKAPIANARVSIERPARVAVTNEKGAFVIRDLPIGTYEMTATAFGRTPVRNTVTVTDGATATVDFSLKSGSLMLSSVVVSATRTATDANQVAGTVNLLTPEQVKLSPARETQDMLREIPGVEMPRTSSTVGGTAQIVSIRGVDEGRTAVLLDGIPLTDAWGEWIDWGRAPKGSIDRVEVFEGGGSNLYGNGAMGGVISLFSRPIAPGSYRLIADGGSRDGRHGFASFGVPLGNAFTLGVSGDYHEGGGYQLIAPANAGPVDGISQVFSRNGTVRLEYAPTSNLSTYISGHLFSDDRRLGTPMTRAFRTDGATNFGLDYTVADVGTFAVRAWDREMRENSVSSSLLTVTGVARASERLNATARIPSYDRGVGLTWSRNKVWGFETVSAGGDYRYNGGFYDEQDYANNAANAPTVHLNSGGNQGLSGAFVNGVIAPAADWRVELSGRFDSWSNNDGIATVTPGSGTTKYANATRNAFSPRVGIRWQALPELSFHTAFYQAFRAPNLAELYRAQTSATTITIPNPFLKPEYATGYEFGLDWQPAAWVQLKGTIYQANYRDFNTFVTTPGTGGQPATRTRQNVQNSRSLGGEVYLAVRPVEHFTFSGSLNYNDDRITSLGPNAPTATTFIGARIGRVPIQKATVRASYDDKTLGTLTVMGRYEGSNTTLGNAFTLPEFGVADVSYAREIFGGLNVFASLENIFDRKYNVNLSGTAAAPIVSLGLPRTVLAGLELTRF